MAAAPDALMQRAKPAMQAVSSTIHHVGSKAGDGQVMKSCLQSIIGAAFSATFEAAALAAKAGVPGQVLYDVISTSGAGCGVINTALEYIIDRKFTGTGSSITTMHKDLTISLIWQKNWACHYSQPRQRCRFSIWARQNIRKAITGYAQN